MPHVKVKARPMARDKPRAMAQGNSLIWLTDAQGFRDLSCQGYTSLADSPEVSTAVNTIARLIAGISDNRIVILLVLYVFLIFVGMFMDATAAIFILVPILLPAVQAVGVSPLFFVVFLVITLSFGLITPPVGVCLYAAENVTGLPLEKIIKASIPWIGLIAISLVIFILFPQIIEIPVSLVFGT